MSHLKKTLCLASMALAVASAVGATGAKSTVPSPATGFGNLPFSFEANRGQADGAVDFLARGQGCQFYISPTEAVLSLHKVEASAGGSRQLRTEVRSAGVKTRMVRLKFLEANPHARVTGEEEQPGRVNYFIGADPARWQTGVPLFARVCVQEIYRGVNLIYYGNQQRIEYDFVVAPKSDPSAIAIRFEGADKIRVDASGDLVLSLGNTEIRQPKPLIYQMIGGARREISGAYRLTDPQTIKFQIGSYDRNFPLVIDPVLSYSTYFGGSAGDVAWAVAVDPSGFIYMAGESLSASLPSGTSQYTNSYGGGTPQHGDAFVAKLDNSGSNIIYRTYLGGNLEEEAFGIAVDAAGNAHITGYTDSTNFPTVNAVSNSISGIPVSGRHPQDAFVAKLGPFGTNLLYSTYLGGNQIDLGEGIAVDGSGNVYVVGYTLSTNFPVRNAFQTNIGGASDAFALKIDATGTNIIYSTFLGGFSLDSGSDVAVDGAGNAYVTGYTSSTNFPVTNAFQSQLNNLTNASTAFDAFVTKIMPAGNALVYSTFLGGINNDFGHRIALDGNAGVYVTGPSSSGDFPGASTNLPSSVVNGGTASDVFVVKLDSVTGTNRIYTAMFGGAGADEGSDIAVDSAGHAHVVGFTSSTDFPVTNTAGLLRAVNSGGTDAFVTELASNGSAFVYSAYLGGASTDAGYGIAVDAMDNTYVVGKTASSDFPTFMARQTNFAGGEDAFLAKIVGSTTQPSLTITLSGPNVVLAWPASASEFTLITQKTNVAAPRTNWTAVPGIPVLINGQQTVTLPATNPLSFFDLFLAQ